MGGEPHPPNGGDVPSDSSALFSQIFFHIVESQDLTAVRVKELRRCLVDRGALEIPLPSTASDISSSNLTHVISATIDFDLYGDLAERMISVVKPTWVDSSVQKNRLANPVSHSPDPRLFFSGLVVCVADLPEGDKEAIIGGVVAMGGLYSGAVSRMVTHIVALSMEPQACQIARLKRLGCKIVLPHWFNDCLRLGRYVDEEPYLLLNHKVSENEGSTHSKTTSAHDPRLVVSDSTSAESPDKCQQIFKGHAILLSYDLLLSNHLRTAIEDVVQREGGQIVKDIQNADTLICQFRYGGDFHAAASQDKTIGNLTWLYHLIRQSSWTDPLRRLLHYPIAREGLPGFKGYRISLSNYNGEARVYLENLAKAAGCEFTKTMKMDNTHLITAHLRSEKCEAAKEWGIKIVNHLWLEESYAKWQIQSLTDARYTHFPAKAKLCDVVGQTSIDKGALEMHFFQVHPASEQAHQNDMAASIQVEQQSSSGLQDKCPNPESGATPSKDLPPAHRSESDNDQEPPSRRRGQGKVSKSLKTALQTPTSLKIRSQSKENETPSTGSRSAKQKAAARLQDMSSDIALYEKERKRVGGVVFGGRRSDDDSVLRGQLKRSASTELRDMSISSGDETHTKRAKKNNLSPVMKLLVTGHKRWTQDQKFFTKDKERLHQLGIILTEDPTACDFVAAPSILRTRKFICAMAHGPTMLETSFLDRCLAENALLNIDDFLLKDAEGEQRYNVELSSALERAKRNQGKLLAGHTVYATEVVHGGFDTYKDIVEANGGSCILYKGRSVSIAPKNDLCEGSRSEDMVYLISGASSLESKLWSKFKSMVQSAGRVPRIVKTDWMLDLALSQEIRWGEHYELKSVNERGV